MSGEEGGVYCICRTSDVDRFMIGCDHCEEWYHGDCVNVTEKDAKYIKRYYCKQCRLKNPKLSIVYKSKHKEDEKSGDRKSSKSSHKDKDRDRDRDEKRKKEKEKRRKEKDAERAKRKETEREKLRQDKKKSDADASDQVPAKSASSAHRPSADSVSNSPQPQVKKKKKKVLRELNYTSESEASAVDAAKEKSDEDESEDAWEPPVVPPVSKSKPKEPAKAGNKKAKASAKKVAASAPRTSRKRGRRGSDSDSDADHKGSFWEAPMAELKGSRQCYGHKCVKEARDGSKYCSEACGINLATLRIMQTLPDRIREWNLTPCEAEKRNRKELEAIRAKQEAVKMRLEQLNTEFRTLEELIATGKAQSIEARDSDDDEDSSTMEMTVHCVTCGADVQTKTAIRHMERCYNKMESRTSFASRFKTQIEDERMFCDYYNHKEGTYCKRLQVLCPEHNPEEKRVVRDDEVCGYPVQREVFGAPVEFCRVAKKACQAHYTWEKLRRAEIDMERVKQWMKVDELLEQERQVKAAMSNRAGVLGLLLHSTFNHDLDGRLRQQQQQQQQSGKAAQAKAK